MTLYSFALGPQPYGDGDGVSYWGERKGRFPDLKSALHGLLSAHQFPSILVGRFKDLFFPGVSLPGAGSHEVIQVWCTSAEAVASLDRFESEFPELKLDYRPHIGDGTFVGLLAEIHVREISHFQTPVIAGALRNGDNEYAYTSPAGVFALSFCPANRNALQVRLLQSRLAGFDMKHRMGTAMDDYKGQMKKFREGFSMMNAYCNGTHGLDTLAHGDRAPADQPYRIFQSRVYLEEELGLLANLADMDHRDMAKIDQWLLSEGRWKKLLPYEKCILVTRICREQKQYSREVHPLEAAYHNHFNMESLVWIRDGGMVWRFATDIQFEERIFPNGDDAPKIVSLIQEKIWQCHWKRSEGSGGTESNEAVPQSDAEAVEPVAVAWRDDQKFDSLESFLQSQHYTPELDAYVHRSASEGLRKHQREMMPFALLMQGVIDHKGLLNIPPGTDIFDLEQQSKYITLVNDFSHGLVDTRYADQFALRARLESLKPGDRILGWRSQIYTEKYSRAAHWNKGYNGHELFVFTVHHVDQTAKPGQFSFKKLFVHEFELTKRWVNESPFTKKMGFVDIDSEQWLPLDLPLTLAEKLLEDRTWKRDNKWAVPVLAQFASIKAQIPSVHGPEPFLVTLENKLHETT